MTATISKQNLTSPKDVMREHLPFLRKCARLGIVERDDSILLIEDIKETKMRDFMAAGKSLNFTDRDLIVHLYKSIWDEPR